MRIRRWTCRQLLVSIALISATGFAYIDAEFREDYGELLGVIVGGYFGQQLPQNGDR